MCRFAARLWLLLIPLLGTTARCADGPSAPLPVASQPLDTLWTTSAGGIKNDACSGVSVDSAGNLLATGHFEYTARFGEKELTANWYGVDIFAAKLNKEGEFAWVTRAGGDKTDRAFGLSMDSSGNSYLTGYITNSASFGKLSVTATLVDGFAAKLDSNGNFIWATTIGGPGEDKGFGIALDLKGNVYVTGSFVHSIKTGSSTAVSNGNSDVFVVRLDKNGNPLWGVTAGGTMDDAGYDVALGVDGSIYVTGYFTNEAKFGSITVGTSSDPPVSRGFVAKWNSDGTFAWVRSIDGADDVRSNGIDSYSGGVYVTGEFAGKATFGGQAITAVGASDIFVSKMDSSGSFVWTKAFGAGSPDAGRGIASDGGGCLVTGTFDSGVDFGNGQKLSGAMGNQFVLVLDSDGSTIRATSGGGARIDNGFAIAISRDSIHVCGDFRQTADYGSTTLDSEGEGDALFWKLKGFE